jgi:acyl-CoA thioester hydrolase
MAEVTEKHGNMQTQFIADFIRQWQHTMSIEVAWGDMDALGHVNNARYFTYLESARIAFLAPFDDIMPLPGSTTGPILAYIDCQFLVPVTFPDEVMVGSSVAEIGNTSIGITQEICSIRHDRTVAQSKTVVVLIDYRTGEKVRVPDPVRAAFRGE